MIGKFLYSFDSGSHNAPNNFELSVYLFWGYVIILKYRFWIDPNYDEMCVNHIIYEQLQVNAANISKTLGGDKLKDENQIKSKNPADEIFHKEKNRRSCR